MARPKVLRQAVTFTALILLGMLISRAIFAGNIRGQLGFVRPATAEAVASAPSTSTQRDPSSPETPTALHTCTSNGVAVFSSRIHVECTTAASGGIRFFALGTTSSSHTARILTILSMAHVTGKSLSIAYDPNDTSGTTIGCLASDCRLI